MLLRRRIVAQYQWRFILRVDHQIKVTITIKIGHDLTKTHRREIKPPGRIRFFKPQSWTGGGGPEIAKGPIDFGHAWQRDDFLLGLGHGDFFAHGPGARALGIIRILHVALKTGRKMHVFPPVIIKVTKERTPRPVGAGQTGSMGRLQKRQ